MHKLSSLLFVFAATTITACGGTTKVDPTTTAGSLTGTWDVTSSFVGDAESQRKGVITLGPDQLVVAWPGKTLTFHSDGGNMSLRWATEYRTKDLVVHRDSPQNLDLGILPLPLGGLWSFNGDGPGNCSAAVDKDVFQAQCEGGVRLESPLPDVNGHIDGKRIDTRTSVFGELGGVWKLSSPTGRYECSAVFEDVTVKIECGGSYRGLTGSTTMTFGDGVVSGTTSEGVEFAAHRR